MSQCRPRPAKAAKLSHPSLLRSAKSARCLSMPRGFSEVFVDAGLGEGGLLITRVSVRPAWRLFFAASGSSKIFRLLRHHLADAALGADAVKRLGAAARPVRARRRGVRVPLSPARSCVELAR